MCAVSLKSFRAGKCERCPLHNLGVCGAATPEALNELDHISRFRDYAAGETILSEGEDARIVGNVVSGVVKISKILPDGRQQIVGLLMAADFFGRAYAKISPFLFEAATDVTLCRMDQRAFEAVVARHRELEHALLVSTLDELDASRDWMLMLGAQTTLERFASYLVILLTRLSAQGCRLDGAAAHNVVELPVGRRDLAAYLGTTVETISRNVQELARRGVIGIVTSSRFEVLDEPALFELSGRDETDLDHAAELRIARRLSA
ncbi:MAG TPA: Crp/Fnr family transcriptional regulator [Devosiaceae bacterium]|nr:Crp/Fnr family transcriptional regulator [Devosiaceae bacterium]